MSLKQHLLAMANKASTTREALMTIDFRKVIEENKEQGSGSGNANRKC